MQKNTKSFFKKSFFIALTLPSMASAEKLANVSTSQNIELPLLQVMEKAIEDAPPNTSIVTKKELDKRFIRNFEDLAKRAEPGVNFNRVNQSINIRGLDGNRVLTTIDGIRIPYLDDRIRGEKGGVDSLDFASLSKLDIVRGVDDKQPASGGLGGNVNLFTLNPEDLLRKGKNVGGILKTDYDSSDDSFGLNLAVAARNNLGTSVLIQAGKRQGHELDNKGHNNSYGTSRTDPDPEDSKQQNFLAKLQQDLGNGHKVGITGENFAKIDDTNTKSNQGKSYAIGHNSNRESVKRQRISANYQYLTPDYNGLIDEANATLYWQHLEKADKQQAYRISAPKGNYMRNNNLQKDMYGMTGSVSKLFTTGFVNQKITVGGEWYQLNAKQKSTGYDNCPNLTTAPPPWDPNFPAYMACTNLHTNQADMPKTHGQQWAVYLADEISFNQGEFVLTPAIRYDYYRHTPQNTSSYKAGNTLANLTAERNKDHKVSGSLAGQWKVAEKATLYASWSQGFKAPDPTELYMNYINNGIGYATLGNAKLKPEESNNFELGANLGDENLGGSVSVFYSKYKNFIDTVSVDSATSTALGLNPAIYRYGVTRWENRNKVKIYGAEARSHWQFATNWKLWGSAAWAVGKDQKTNQHLNSVAPLTAIFGLGYSKNNYGGDLMLTTATKRNKVETDTDFKAPGYGVVDLTAYWEPKQVKGLRLQAGVFNLMDKKYWNALNVPDSQDSATSLQPYDFYSEPGRSFRVSATYQF